jgi:hypothetical protein
MNLTKYCAWTALAIGLTLAPTAGAGTLSFAGSLNPNNSNDTFSIQFSALSSVTVILQSYGFGGTSATASGMNAAGQIIPSGGFDTYLSLFNGIGDSATFRSSNDDGLCPPAATDQGNCYDSRLTALSLPIGTYTFVLSAAGNMSFAENLGTGTLGDGFIGLASPDYGGRTSSYALDLTFVEGRIALIPTGVPEPANWLPASAALLVLFGARRFRSVRRT